ncbi:MAG: hypothetical protein AAGI37_08690 [Planctomycetota bacterium]
MPEVEASESRPEPEPEPESKPPYHGAPEATKEKVAHGSMQESTLHNFPAPEKSYMDQPTSEVPRSHVKSAGTLIAIILMDFIVLCTWFGCSWAFFELAAFAESRDFVPLFAQLFAWISSIGTLALAIIFIVKDVIGELRGPSR